jgi:hypothetical protein
MTTNNPTPQPYIKDPNLDSTKPKGSKDYKVPEPDKTPRKILIKFFEAAYSQREADMDTPSENNRAYAEAEKAIQDYAKSYAAGLISEPDTPNAEDEKLREQISKINEYSLENGSDTPDFILAQYLDDCLQTYNAALKARDKWYGFKPFDGGITTLAKRKR